MTSKVGWKTVKFSDVVRNANLVERDPVGAGIERIVGLEHIDPENLHIRRWNSPEDGTSFSRKFVPASAVRGCGPGGGWIPEKGIDLTLPGIWQVAVDGVCSAEAAYA